MRARAHSLLGATVWLGTANVFALTGHPLSLTGDIGGTLIAAGWAIWPDVDCCATPGAALGWPSRFVAWVIGHFSNHRGWTHRAVSTVVLSGLALMLAVVPYVSFGFTLLGVAWAQAALTADRPRTYLPRRLSGQVRHVTLSALFLRRPGPAVRLAISLGLTALLLALDPAPGWLPLAVLVGGLSHLLGDCFTRRPFAALAPLWRREVGGWGIIPPTRDGQRVTWQEWLIEGALVVACIAAAWSLIPTGVAA
jgi:membrane-bound metal-dependent hydrolase YbcI (DUF457 family)